MIINTSSVELRHILFPDGLDLKFTRQTTGKPRHLGVFSRHDRVFSRHKQMSSPSGYCMIVLQFPDLEATYPAWLEVDFTRQLTGESPYPLRLCYYQFLIKGLFPIPQTKFFRSPFVCDGKKPGFDGKTRPNDGIPVIWRVNFTSSPSG